MHFIGHSPERSRRLSMKGVNTACAHSSALMESRPISQSSCHTSSSNRPAFRTVIRVSINICFNVLVLVFIQHRKHYRNQKTEAVFTTVLVPPPPTCYSIASISYPFSIARLSAVASGLSMVPSNKNRTDRGSNAILSQKTVMHELRKEMDKSQYY